MTPAASPQEAAAIAAAIQQFIAETAPLPGPSATQSRWQRAALEDGAGARASLPSRWGTAPG